MSPDFGAGAIIRHAFHGATGFGNQVFVLKQADRRVCIGRVESSTSRRPQTRKYVRDLVSGVCVVDSTISARQQKLTSFFKDVVLLEKPQKDTL